MVAHAEAIAGVSVMTLPEGRWEVAVKELQEAGEGFPTNMKLSMWKRIVTTLKEEATSSCNVGALLEAALPWRPSSGAAELFDALSPKLWALEASPVERAQMFVDTMIAPFLAIVKKGA